MHNHSRWRAALYCNEIGALQPAVPERQIVEVDGVKRLERTFKLENFIETVAFTNKVTMTPEKKDHVLVT